MESRSSAVVSSPHKLPPNVKFLGVASLLNDIASEMIFPLLPRFLLSVLRGNLLHLGVIEGAADSTASLLKLWSGAKSDQGGRRKGFVAFGYATGALTRPLIAVITLPWQLFILRVGDRIGKGVRTSPRDAMIADSTDPSIRGRAFGFHRAMDHFGAALGPLVAAGFLLLWPDEWRLLFALTLVPGLLVIGLIVFGLREKPTISEPQQSIRLTLKPFDGNFRLFLLALTVFTLGNSSDAFLLVRAGDLGVPTARLPLLWCAFHIVKSASNLLLGRAVDRFGPRPFIFLGWMLYALVYLGFAMAATAWHALVFFLIYGVYYGLTEPAEKTLVVRLANSENKGLAYGWYNFAIGIVTLPASILFGALYQYLGVAVAFGFGTALAVIAVVLLAGVKEGESQVSRFEPPFPAASLPDRTS